MFSLVVKGAAGSTTQSRFMGAHAGAPTSGTYVTNDWILDTTNHSFQYCTAGGTPGTWQQITASGGYASLTGLGSSTRPGKLTQDGDFEVDGADGGNVLIQSGTSSSSAGGFIELNNNPDADIDIRTWPGSSAGITLDDQGTGGVLIEADNAPMDITIGGLHALTLAATSGEVDLVAPTINLTGTNHNSIVLASSGDVDVVINGGTGRIELANAGSGGILLDDSGCGGVRLASSGQKVGFFGTTPTTLKNITGALSSVTDTNAKAVLTSIIAALAASGYGLVHDSTT
jgi:hypothetical protein